MTGTGVIAHGKQFSVFYAKNVITRFSFVHRRVKTKFLFTGPWHRCCKHVFATAQKQPAECPLSRP